MRCSASIFVMGGERLDEMSGELVLLKERVLNM